MSFMRALSSAGMIALACAGFGFPLEPAPLGAGSPQPGAAITALDSLAEAGRLLHAEVFHSTFDEPTARQATLSAADFEGTQVEIGAALLTDWKATNLQFESRTDEWQMAVMMYGANDMDRLTSPDFNALVDIASQVNSNGWSPEREETVRISSYSPGTGNPYGY
jgi:hypothetical protein